MGNTILLVVDVQASLIENHPYNEASFLANIKTSISLCRENCIDVIYVRHDGGTGDELESGTDGWQICKAIAPQAGDKIFDKNFSSAFRGTGLKEYLDSKNTGGIILVGMQTEYCIDTTCKVAFEYGYDVIIPEETTTTFDNSYLSGKVLSEYYTKMIWDGRFARIISMEDLNQHVSGLVKQSII